MNRVALSEGGYVVLSGDHTVMAGPFGTNAEAWRALDRLDGQPINPAEKRTDFATSRALRGD